MTTSTTPVRVVLIGLPKTHHSVPEELRTLVVNGLDELPTKMADAGIHYELDPVSPEEGLAELGPKLQSQRPDAIIIGNGIRRNMEFTYFMEQVIEVAQASAPKAKLLFNTMPQDSVDAVRRWFPTVK